MKQSKINHYYYGYETVESRREKLRFARLMKKKQFSERIFNATLEKGDFVFLVVVCLIVIGADAIIRFVSI